MRDAVLRDLSDLPGVTVVALRDERLPAPSAVPSQIDWVEVGPEPDFEWQLFRELQSVDAAWVIAPESSGILERMSRLTEGMGKVLLGSSSRAVRLAASKLETARRLSGCGVPVVPTEPVVSNSDPFWLPCVAKPDDGAGCDGIRIVLNRDDWDDVSRQTFKGIAQPLLDGVPLSLSALFFLGHSQLLACNRQYIRRTSRGFFLDGCGVNSASDQWPSFERLAERIAAAVPELWGYAGVDLIRMEDELQVLEINPRTTTSYVGLRSSIGINPAGLILDLWRDGALPKLPRIAARQVDVMIS